MWTDLSQAMLPVRCADGGIQVFYAEADLTEGDNARE